MVISRACTYPVFVSLEKEDDNKYRSCIRATLLKARISVKLSLKSNAIRGDSFQNDVLRNAFKGVWRTKERPDSITYRLLRGKEFFIGISLEKASRLSYLLSENKSFLSCNIDHDDISLIRNTCVASTSKISQQRASISYATLRYVEKRAYLSQELRS